MTISGLAPLARFLSARSWLKAKLSRAAPAQAEPPPGASGGAARTKFDTLGIRCLAVHVYNAGRTGALE